MMRDYIDSLVHPTAQRDALTAARHRAFIAPRLLGSFVALAAFPLYLILRGVPSMLEVLVFGWLIAPILTAYFLSRTGRYETAHILCRRWRCPPSSLSWRCRPAASRRSRRSGW